MRLVLALLLVLGTLTSAHAQGFAPTSSVSGGGSSSGGCDPSALSDGAVLFVASGACAGNATYFAWDNTAYIQRIGTPYAAFTDQSPGLWIGANDVDGYGAVLALMSNDHLGRRPTIYAYSSEGTQALPADSLANDHILEIHALGYHSGFFQEIASVEMVVDSVSAPNGLGGRWSVLTNYDGVTGPIERLRIDSAGRSRFGDSLSDTTFPSGSRENNAVISGRADGGSGTDLSYVTLSAVEDFYSLVFNAATGSFASPTAFVSGVLGAINFQGYNGGSYGADVSLIAATDGSYSSAFPTKFTITTHNNAGTARTWTLDSAGVAVNSGALMLGSSTKLTLTATELGMAHSIAASGSAPGAGGGKSAYICGSTSGTLKWIVYGGTSTTYTVMADNLGGSATSC